MNDPKYTLIFLFFTALFFSCEIESDNLKKGKKVLVSNGVNVLLVDSLNYLIIKNDSAQFEIEIDHVTELGEILDRNISMIDADGYPLTTYGMIRISGSETMFPAYVKWVNLETKKIPDVNLYAYDFDRNSWVIQDSLDRKANCFIEFSRNTWINNDNEVGGPGLCQGHMLAEVSDSLLNTYFDYCEVCDCRGWIVLDFFGESDKERKIIEMKRSYSRFNDDVGHVLDSVLDKLCFRHYGPIPTDHESRVFFTFENSEEKGKEVLQLTAEEIQGLERYGVNIERAIVYSIPAFGFYNLDKVTEGVIGELQVLATEGVSDVFWVNRKLKSILSGEKIETTFTIENAVLSSNFEILTIDSLNHDCIFQLYQINSSDAIVSLENCKKACLTAEEVRRLMWD